MESTEPIVIVGGGPVGLFLALKLGLNGLPVTLLEAEGGIVNSPRALGYYPQTSAALDRVGVLKDVCARGVQCTTSTLRKRDGTVLAEIDWAQGVDLQPYNYLMLLGQNSICQVLLEHIARLPRIDIRWGRRVTSFEQDADAVVLCWESAQGRGELRSSWVVGTDGARSIVREQLGLSLDGFTWPQRLVATNVFYDFALHGYSRAEHISDPEDWAVIAQIDKTGLWRVAYGEDADISEAEVRARLPERFRRILPGAPGPTSYRVDMCTPYRIHQRSAPTYRVGRVLLAGDAAHITNPIGGLGLSGGIVDVDQLGLVLAQVVNGQCPESALDVWADRRRRVFLEYASPTASENLRRISEKDPERRAADEAMLAQVRGNPDVQRMMLRESALLLGDQFDVPA